MLLTTPQLFPSAHLPTSQAALRPQLGCPRLLLLDAVGEPVRWLH